MATGSLSKAWGFFGDARRVPGREELAAALAASGRAQVELDPLNRTVRFRRAGVEFNPGSIGKGYAIDRALERIRGARCVLMQGGQSSLKALGAPMEEPRGWRVAIGDPQRPGRALAMVWLKNRALGTSGAANQYFIAGGRKYGHVLDPRTGWPADQVASASALAASAAEADALSTAFFVLGVEGTRAYCQRHPEVGAVLVTKSRTPEVKVIGADDTEVEQ
jgi:thiamine biosynthesis lipoprotein